jgi:hypothetical protein
VILWQLIVVVHVLNLLFIAHSYIVNSTWDNGILFGLPVAVIQILIALPQAIRLWFVCCAADVSYMVGCCCTCFTAHQRHFVRSFMHVFGATLLFSYIDSGLFLTFGAKAVSISLTVFLALEWCLWAAQATLNFVSRFYWFKRDFADEQPAPIIEPSMEQCGTCRQFPFIHELAVGAWAVILASYGAVLLCSVHSFYATSVAFNLCRNTNGHDYADILCEFGVNAWIIVSCVIIIGSTGEKQLLFRALGERTTIGQCGKYHWFVFAPGIPLVYVIYVTVLHTVGNWPGVNPSFHVNVEFVTKYVAPRTVRMAENLNAVSLSLLVIAWIQVATLGTCNVLGYCVPRFRRAPAEGALVATSA